MILCEKYGWIRVDCCDEDGNLRSIGDIHERICGLL